MATKAWDYRDVRELAAMAKKKGLKKAELAAMIGIHATTLSDWMNESRTSDLPLVSQNALHWVEYRVARMADRK